MRLTVWVLLALSAVAYGTPEDGGSDAEPVQMDTIVHGTAVSHRHENAKHNPEAAGTEHRQDIGLEGLHDDQGEDFQGGGTEHRGPGRPPRGGAVLYSYFEESPSGRHHSSGITGHGNGPRLPSITTHESRPFDGAGRDGIPGPHDHGGPTHRGRHNHGTGFVGHSSSFRRPRPYGPSRNRGVQLIRHVQHSNSDNGNSNPSHQEPDQPVQEVSNDLSGPIPDPPSIPSPNLSRAPQQISVVSQPANSPAPLYRQVTPQYVQVNTVAQSAQNAPQPQRQVVQVVGHQSTVNSGQAFHPAPQDVHPVTHVVQVHPQQLVYTVPQVTNAAQTYVQPVTAPQTGTHQAHVQLHSQDVHHMYAFGYSPEVNQRSPSAQVAQQVTQVQHPQLVHQTVQQPQLVHQQVQQPQLVHQQVQQPQLVHQQVQQPQLVHQQVQQPQQLVQFVQPVLQPVQQAQTQAVHSTVTQPQQVQVAQVYEQPQAQHYSLHHQSAQVPQVYTQAVLQHNHQSVRIPIQQEQQVQASQQAVQDQHAAVRAAAVATPVVQAPVAAAQTQPQATNSIVQQQAQQIHQTLQQQQLMLQRLQQQQMHILHRQRQIEQSQADQQHARAESMPEPVRPDQSPLQDPQQSPRSVLSMILDPLLKATRGRLRRQILY